MATTQTMQNRKKQLIEKFGLRCYYCRREFPENELTLDHAKPKSKGGGDHLTNLVLACRPCNYDKGDLTRVEYMQLIRKNNRIEQTDHDRKIKRVADDMGWSV